jgi:hypothetical protein
MGIRAVPSERETDHDPERDLDALQRIKQLQLQPAVSVVQSNHLPEGGAFDEVVVAGPVVESTAVGVPVPAEAVVPDDAEQVLRFGLVLDDQASALQQSDLVGEGEVRLGVHGHGMPPGKRKPARARRAEGLAVLLKSIPQNGPGRCGQPSVVDIRAAASRWRGWS